jgi:hypothetical protein
LTIWYTVTERPGGQVAIVVQYVKADTGTRPTEGSYQAALGYRRRVGPDPVARIGVVVPEMAAPDVAGVLFIRDPRHGRRRNHRGGHDHETAAVHGREGADTLGWGPGQRVRGAVGDLDANVADSVAEP